MPLENAPRLQDPGRLAAPGWEASLNASYVGSATTRFIGVHLADSDAKTVSLGVGRQIDINKEWFAHLGLASDNIFLGTVSGAPVPASIHTLHLNASLGCKLNEEWSLSAVLFPSLYRLDQLSSDDLGIAGGFVATWRADPSLTWTFGIMADPNSDLKVLPVLGVRWLIDDHSMLEVGFPKTRYSYRLDSQWSLYVGGDFSGSTFRTSENLGNQIGASQYNRALGTYRDARIGPGVTCRITRGLRAELEGGYSVYRRIDYTRIGQTVDFDPAPYVRAGLSGRF